MSKLEELAPVFYPKSHAVIGASADTRKFSGRYLPALLGFGYPGRLYVVNPKEPEVIGVRTCRTVGELPEAVDFATIVVPATAVPGVARECLARGIKAAQVLSAGFREAGEEGARLERELAEVAAAGLRIVGPNCFGVYSPGGGLTILPGVDFPRESGPVGFISQSGGYSVRVPRRATGMGIRFSKVISYGNACDVNECDLLEYLGEDPETKVVAGYIEGVQDGPRFLRLLKEVCRTKPVILWKGGLTRAGAHAVRSHTASLGGGEEIWNALFQQSGAVRVSGLEELLDTMLAFLHLAPEPRGRAVVIGGGGGIGVAAADICEREGLALPVSSAALQRKLAAIVPPSGTSVRNPVDVGSPIPAPPMLKAVLETVAAEADFDLLIVDELAMGWMVPTPDGPDLPEPVPEGLAGVPLELKPTLGKPLVAVMPVEAVATDGLEAEANRRRVAESYLRHGIPVFLTIERAVRALANFVGYYRRRDSKPTETGTVTITQGR